MLEGRDGGRVPRPERVGMQRLCEVSVLNGENLRTPQHSCSLVIPSGQQMRRFFFERKLTQM